MSFFSSIVNTCSNLFGLVNGQIFGEPPLYVDKTKPAGMTPTPKPTVRGWMMNAPFVLINSPNFVWACISLAIYFTYPYDLSPTSSAAIAPISMSFLAERLPIWILTTFLYTGFWHFSLHTFKLANRPYIPNRPYNYQKLFHNMSWVLSGIVIWTVFENIFCYLWATNRLSYINDFNSFNTYSGGVKFVLALMAIPLWRSWHFYFAHRFLHFKPLYQHVHSLHHRNTDTEPFSGLCMHPVEHLYYYSCILPSLLFVCSPFAFLWNGVHLLLSPAASHSGWEDHFQSDTFHYLHHLYFECNYAGQDASFMDVIFGTYIDKLKDTPTPREDSKSTLLSYPTFEFVRYLGLSYLCGAVWLYFVTNKIELNIINKLIVSSLVGFGPVILAWLLSNKSIVGTKMENNKGMNFFGNFLHTFVGSLFCSVPITYMCWLAL